ncbi:MULTISPECIES: GGDEF domain-containing protein [unclassified Pseudoalteromonas]|uniref:GGDEF domain-containing protein n=1 Tax=unclassified Pseudoalteromonas TaxID=194690 RepID=UPI0025B3D551|nr:MULTISPECIES: GGDEF domain-containing protein [unclassified Pseudoalteromonas]MDN3379236.1 diguanylate cyclase [Pseudoalteromonas sp. APC 3893]MDN3386410.1 diguanylate cyclase [Pseudoalteromonas sp. APC 4017]
MIKVYLFLIIAMSFFSGSVYSQTEQELGYGSQEKLEFYYKKLKKDIAADDNFSIMQYLPQLRTLAVSQKSNDIEIETYLLEAKIKRRYGSYEQGLKLNYQALSLAKSYNNEIYIAWAYLHLANLQLELDKFSSALEYLQNAIDFYEKEQSDYTALMYLWQSKIYLAMGSYYQALESSKKALNLVNSNAKIHFDVSVNHATILLKLGKDVAADTALKNVDSSFIDSAPGQMKLQYYLALANLNLQKGNFLQATKIAVKQLNQNPNTRFLEERAQLQYLVAMAYRQLKQYKLAYEYLALHTFSKKTFNLQRRNNKLLQLEAHYNFDIQSQKLQVLSKDNALKEQRLLQQEQLFENHKLEQQKWILAVVLFFGAMGFIYWRWQNQRYLVKLQKRVDERTAELAKSNERLKAFSFTDSLTGLNNRHYLYNAINSVLEKQSNLVFALIDIDHFKKINDTYGHNVGDQVLEQFSSILKKYRTSEDLLIRWGGEEFLFISSNKYHDSAKMFEQIRQEVSAHPFVSLSGEKLTITCSIGFANYPFVKDSPQDFSWEQVVELADGGLYLAKENQRNAWVGLSANENVLTWDKDAINNYREYIQRGHLIVKTNIKTNISIL